MVLVIFLALVALILIVGIRENKKKVKYKKGLMNDEERIKYENQLAKQEQIKKSKTIKQVMIVSNSSDSRKKVGSTIIRGAIGNAVLGTTGLVGGALSGKNKISNKTTFLIEYEDGHRETREVDNDSQEFKKMCNYLKMN